MVPQSRDSRSLLHRRSRKTPPVSWPPVQFLPGQIASGLFPPLHADTPDVGQFAQVLPERLLTIGGKCPCLRAKAAHISGHLPVGYGALGAVEAQARRSRAFPGSRWGWHWELWQGYQGKDRL